MTHTTRLVAGFTLALSASGVLSATPVHDRVEWGQTPEWTETAEVETGGAALGGPVSQLLVDDQVRVSRSGPRQVYRRVLYRIEDRAALEEWSSLSVQFAPSYQRVILHGIGLYREGEWQDRRERSRLDVIQREAELDRQMFDQTLSLLVVLEDVRVGDVVELAYSVIGSNPAMKRLSGAFSLGWGFPVAHRRLRFLAHRSRDLQVSTYGDAPTPRVQQSGEWVETVLERHDVPAFPYQENVPNDWELYPWAQYTEFRSWGEVVDWALPLYDAVRETPEELATVAGDLISQGNGDADRIRLARNWVQDQIRYYGILVGEHSYVPHRPTEVLSRRYGDCKDKSVVLIALLQAMGIEAWPALVNSEYLDAIEGWLPSPLTFTHVIVVARAEGETLWIDPTLHQQGGSGLDLYIPPFGVALELRRDANALSRLPQEASRPGAKRISHEYRVEENLANSSVRILSSYERAHAERMRTYVASISHDELTRQYLDYYSAPGLEVHTADDLRIQDDRDANRLVITEEYSLKREPEPSSPAYFETLPLEIGNSLAIPANLERDAPLAIPYPMELTESVYLEVTKEVILEPVEEFIENPWFRFLATSQTFDGGLLINYNLETLQRTVEPPDLFAYAVDVERVQSALGYSIWDGAADDPELRKFAATTLAWVLGAFFVVAGVATLAWTRL